MAVRLIWNTMIMVMLYMPLVLMKKEIGSKWEYSDIGELVCFSNSNDVCMRVNPTDADLMRGVMRL